MTKATKTNNVGSIYCAIKDKTSYISKEARPNLAYGFLCIFCGQWTGNSHKYHKTIWNGEEI